MPAGQTGKQRARQIPLDYYKHDDALVRWKRLLAWAALFATIAWWASGLELTSRGGRMIVQQSDRGRLRESRGPVARVHATWEAQCSACHVSFSPIVPNHWARAIRTGPSPADQRCTLCHAGPAHHQNQKRDQAPGCADCHHEHRGREASLVYLPDVDCTSCHAHLAARVEPGAARAGYRDITSFAIDHPEFRAVEQGAGSDPGRIKFNHALHMTPGMVLAAGGMPFTLAQLDNAVRDRYRQPGQPDTGAVRLDCASCHRTDAADRSASGGLTVRMPARSAGAHMLPVLYENDCRACHRLNIEPVSIAKREDGRSANERAVPLEAPHGLQPDRLHKALQAAYLERYTEGKPDLLARAPAPNPMPGKAASAEDEQLRSNIESQVYRAEKILYLGKQTCAECHLFEAKNGASATALNVAEQIERGRSPAFRVVASSVPEVWLQHAVFTHQAHRAVDCRGCHATAYAKSARGAEGSKESRDVLLPGIATCRQCHAPAGHSAAGATGGAGFDCTECHRYHNGDVPLHGPGSSARDARRHFAIDQFLAPAQPAPDRPGAGRDDSASALREPR